jgi:hypothetical protein
MRTILTLAILLISVINLPGKDIRGTWFKIVAGKAIVRVYDDFRFYSLFLDRSGGIALYATGTYKFDHDQVTYSYDGGLPKKTFPAGKVDTEAVEVGLDSLVVSLGGKKMTFASLREGVEHRLDTRRVKEKIHEASEADRIPTRIKSPPIVYPYDLRREQVSGIVIEEIVISQNGSVVCARSIGSNAVGFVRSVAYTIREVKYEPPTIDGQAACIRMFVPILFNIEE